MDQFKYLAAAAIISELLYRAQQQPKSIKYDVSFLIDQALDNGDKEMFMWLTSLQ